MIAFHRDHAALATIALFHPANIDYYSRLEIDAAQKLRRMRLLMRRDPLQYDDYPPNLDAGVAATLSAFMYCGVIVAEPSVLDLIPPKTPWSLMEGLFAPMVANAQAVFGYVHTGYFRTMDDLKSYDALKAEFASSSAKNNFIARSAPRSNRCSSRRAARSSRVARRRGDDPIASERGVNWVRGYRSTRRRFSLHVLK